MLERRYAQLAAAGNFTTRLEQIYHAGQLDPATAAGRWAAVMDQCLAAGRFDRCRALIILLTSLPEADASQGRFIFRVARADIGLGRWAEAEALLESLPAGSPHATALRAEVAFCRGDFAHAEDLARAALGQADGAAREGFLFRLAEIELYRGRFADARGHARDGLGLAQDGRNTTGVCRWTNLLAEIDYFSGNVDSATALVGQALAGLQWMPEQERDQVPLASLLQNDALVHEATGDWQLAVQRQEQALGIRREAEDARGAAQSLHGIGKACCGLGRTSDAERTLDEAAHAADGLGERLLRAKITHALADTRVAQQRLGDAVELAEQALDGFRRHGTPYDVASAQLTLACISARMGRCAQSVTYADQARATIEAGGYRVLYQLFPGQAVPPAARIRAGLLAFAAGDAVGVPWEGRPPSDIDPDRVPAVPARDGWPRGATSDDTAQLLLVARNLVGTHGRAAEREFLEQLARDLPEMRGAGPTTPAAVERYQQDGRIYATAGATNGALMRILPAGWAIPATRTDRRRDVVSRLTRVTHGAPVAVAVACAVAAMASYALEGCPAGELTTMAADEFEQVLGEQPGSGAWVQAVRAAAHVTWTPGPAGVTLEAAETLASVIQVLAVCGDDLEKAVRYAVSLGGDTETVAAITGGILGCRAADAAISWLDHVIMPDAAELERLSVGLRQVRRAAYG